MDNDKNIEKLIIDYIDGKLSASDSEEVARLIDHHEQYQHLEQEYRILFDAMDEYIADPGDKLRSDFEAMLFLEESHMDQNHGSKSSKVIQVPLKAVYRIAAVLALMLGSYWFGNYTTKRELLSSLANLETQKQELKAIAALSLFESESASKRIQAVTYSMELERPDFEIINALIYEMQHDQLVNVRLASARALEQFAEHEMVKDAFIEALKSEENDTMQIELIEILSHLKEKRAIPKMKEILQDESTPVFIKDQVKTELQKII
ncbi:MAG: HEAT repeat domain-containing protein [Bacteroidota bacterium]